ncbi:MAG: hypothetical protein ACWGNV_06740 [Bacteroidales bacterium]
MKTKHLITAVTLTCAMIFTCSAQTSMEWIRTFGGESMDMASTICSTPDGGYLLGGSTASEFTGSGDQQLNGVIDYWIVKVDREGNRQWDKTYGGDTFDELKVIKSVSGGGFILGGRSTSSASGDKSEETHGEYDFWVVKIDGSGEIEWERSFGGAGNDNLETLVETDQGGYLLAGSTDSPKRNKKYNRYRSTYDFWAVRIDLKGNMLWERRFGGKGDDRLEALLELSDGGFLLGGSSTLMNQNPIYEGSGRDIDFRVIRLNDSGEVRWDKTYGDSKDDFLTCITYTDNGFLLGGNVVSEQGKSDYQVIHIASDGNVIWNRKFESGRNDKLFCVRNLEDGGFILGGNSNPMGFRNNSLTTTNWMVCIDQDGKEYWKDEAGSGMKGYTSFAGMVSDGASGIILFGNTGPADDDGTEASNAQPTTDFFLSRFTPGINLMVVADTITYRR